MSRRQWIVGLAALGMGGLLVKEVAKAAAPVRFSELPLLGETPAESGRPLRPLPISYAVSHLGLRWVGDQDARIQIRWRGPSDAWPGWRDVLVAHDLGDDVQRARFSGLLRVDRPAAVQVVVLDGEVSHLRVVTIDTSADGDRARVGENARPPEARTADAGDHRAADQRPTNPRIVTRAQWGADESLRRGRPAFAPISRMSIHHTVTENDDPDPAATVRAILAYHTQGRGWDDIGYNFLIDAAGVVYEGRFARRYGAAETSTGEDDTGRGVIGAHTGNDNPGTVGVALLGTFTSEEPSRAALDALTGLLAWKADRHGVDPLGTTAWSTGTHPTMIGHRDASATSCPGDRVYSALPAVRQGVADQLAEAAAPPSGRVVGYWLLTRDGRVLPFGEATELPANEAEAAPAGGAVRSLAPTATGDGYWILAADGRVIPFGDAQSFGSLATMELNAPVVRLQSTPSGRGYWALAADGGVFAFGDAHFLGSAVGLTRPGAAVAIASTPTGAGYWVAASDGGVFAFGDARFAGSAVGPGASHAAVVALAARPTGDGYWLLTADGHVLPFGRARFHGDIPGAGVRGAAASAQIRPTPSGLGYHVVNADGGVFAFGDARFLGAAPGRNGRNPVVDAALQTRR